MFEILARPEVADLEAESGHPPFLVLSIAPLVSPALVFTPVAADAGELSGCWAPEHWDGFENTGAHAAAAQGPAAMTVDEASDYLAHGW